MIGSLEVSEIGIGTMGFSHGYGEVPDEEYTIKSIRKANDYSSTFVDTAENYGDDGTKTLKPISLLLIF